MWNWFFHSLLCEMISKLKWLTWLSNLISIESHKKSYALYDYWMGRFTFVGSMVRSRQVELRMMDV